MSDTTGDDIDSNGQGGASTSSGLDFSITDEIGNTTATTGDPGNGFTVGDLASAIGSLFGITPASAAVIVSPSGRAVGIINLPPGVSAFPNVNLGALLLGLKATISPTGAIKGPNGVSGQVTGFAGMPPGLRDDFYSVQINTSDEVDLDNPDSGFTATNNSTGEVITLGYYHPAIWNQAAGIGGVPIAWPAQRTLVASLATSMFSSIGVPVMDYANVVAMFSKQNSFLHGHFIGGLDGIYSLHTGKRVVPPQGAGYPAPLGFSIGQYANYAESYLLLACSSAGYELLMGGTGDYINCIDPSTGHTLVPAAYAWVKIFNGSQQINLVLQPTYQYAGPNPTAANPGYNSSIGKLAISSNITNNAVITPQAYIQMNPGANPGGPDGPGGGG